MKERQGKVKEKGRDKTGKKGRKKKGAYTRIIVREIMYTERNLTLLWL